MKWAALLLLMIPSCARATLNAHPRLWYQTPIINMWIAKKNANDTDYNQIKSDIDSYLANSQLLWKWTVTSCTAANPIVCTTAENMTSANAGATWGTLTLFVGGLTGNWAALNTDLSREGLTATQVDATHFSIAVNGTTFGSFSGQTMTNFWRNTSPTAFILDYEFVGSRWLYFAQATIMLFEVTGNTAYRTAALQLLDYINSLSAVNLLSPLEPSITGKPGAYNLLNDGCYGTRNVLPATALIFDHFYSALSPTQKTATVASGNLWAPYIYQKNDNSACFEDLKGYPNGVDFSSGNFWGGHLLGLGMMGYATWGDNPTDSGDTNAWITAANTYYNQFWVAAHSSPDGNQSGGSALESFNYGGQHLARVMEYLWARFTSANDDQLGSYSTGIAKIFIYSLMPNKYISTRLGTWPGDQCLGVIDGQAMFRLAAIFQETGHTTEAGWLQFEYDLLNNLSGSGGCLNDALSKNVAFNTEPERAMYIDKNITNINYTLTLPLNYISTGGWEFYNRTDWFTGAVHVLFSLNPQKIIDHRDKQFGTIDIQRGSDPLIMQQGQWADGDPLGTGNGNLTSGNDTFGSGFSNNLFFNDGGAYLIPGDGSSGNEHYLGGAETFAPYHHALSRGTTDFVFGENDLTYGWDIGNPVPANRTLRYWFRSVLSFGAATVVADLVKASSSTYDKHLRFYLNTTSAPTVAGSTASAVIGASKIFVSSLLPTSPSVTAIKNTTGLYVGLVSNTYRVKITTGSPNTDMNALTVLYATSSAGSLPSTVALATIDANHIGAQIQDTTPLVAIFPGTVTNNGNNTYTLNSFSSATFTSTHTGTAKYVVAGLTAGTYNVTGPCATLCSSQTVGADGTLFFTGTSGAFSISNSSPPPPSVGSSIGNGVILSNGVTVQ